MLTVDPIDLTRRNTLDFKPPLPARWLQTCFHALLPLLHGQVLGGLRVTIHENSLDKLRALRGQRCLLLPNHPSEWDPCVLFEMGKRLRENFYFVAAREVFDYDFGLRGWFFQRLGVYSLVRGSNDRKSLKTSLQILSENRGRLVIFVEGEISSQNETLLPLEAGVLQLAMMSLGELYKENGKNLEALPPLYVCPVGLRYEYASDGLEAAIEKALKALEAAAGLHSSASHSRYERLLALTWEVLRGAAWQLGYSLDETRPEAENVGALTHFMLAKLEQVVNIPPNPAAPALDRVRGIRNKVDQVLSVDEESLSPYRQHLQAHQRSVLRHFYGDLTRVVNFIAVYDGYLSPEMTAARTVEYLRRLEKEVFGTSRLLHPRTALATVADPINLTAHFADFQADKKATVHTLSLQVERLLAKAIVAKSP